MVREAGDRADARVDVYMPAQDNDRNLTEVMSPPHFPITNDDLAASTVQLVHNGEEVATATGAAASGDPLAGVVWLAACLAERGRPLRAGELIITGGLTAAVPLDHGDSIEAMFDREVTVSVRRSAPG